MPKPSLIAARDAGQTAPKLRPIVDEFRWLFERSRAKVLRSMRAFAEEEVILPDGPYSGLRFDCDRQPFSRLWFAEIDSGTWSEFNAVGPSQSGKTLQCSLIPLLYHLFEIGEKVIFALPDLDMAADKWRDDIEPIIAASRYRDLLPSRGTGSKGASKVKHIKFNNNATLRFMTGGGDDKSRAHYTSRIVIITETDGLDKSAETSREADKIKQLKARTRAYGGNARIYKECTVTVALGHIWRAYQEGTASRIVLPCPHCAAWVSPEREHLHGHETAATVVDAKEAGHFACPECNAVWSEDDRRRANAGNKLVHKGQEIAPDGTIHGTAVRTDALGFRWSAVNNNFVSAGELAKGEWKARREPDEDNAEKEQVQFVWAWPHTPPAVVLAVIDPLELCKRTTNHGRGLVPAGTLYLTAAMDLGKYLCHWIVMAWRDGAAPHIVDYGRIEVASRELGEERGLLLAMRQFRDDWCEPGWKMEGAESPVSPDVVFIDAGWGGSDNTVVYTFTGECAANSMEQYRPARGQGKGKQYSNQYRDPSGPSERIGWVGDHCFAKYQQSHEQFLFLFDADYWKTFMHARCETPRDMGGALTLFRPADEMEHMTLAKHVTAEEKQEEYIPGKGVVVSWKVRNRNNHWLDAATNACVAGYFAGARLMGAAPQEAASEGIQIVGGLSMPDGRPFASPRRG